MVCPSFHRIVLPSSVQAGLAKIPPKFLKCLNENFPGDAILVGPSGEQWKVTILKKGNDMCMQNGLPKFLTDHSVMPYELLLFTYDGENCFRVQIFSKSGLERQYPQKIRQEEAVTPSLKKMKNGRPQKPSASTLHFDESKFDQEEFPPSNKGTLPKCYFPKPLRQSSIKIGETTASKLAESFTSGNPYFKHLMKKSVVENQCMLQIPAEFSRKYIPEAVKEIILHSSEGKYWKVTVSTVHGKGKSYSRLVKGWKKFVKENKLKIGDTCIFELEGNNHMKVHTFRCSAN